MELSHVDKNGNVKMVNVGDKPVTSRKAVATGKVFMADETVKAVSSGAVAKGNVIATAKVAGIMAAKRTGEIIPMCHNLPLTGVDVDIELKDGYAEVTATACTDAKTGVEMEALTAVGAACLTIYDMVKAIDKNMLISEIKLVYKEGGKSGVFRRKDE